MDHATKLENELAPGTPVMNSAGNKCGYVYEKRASTGNIYCLSGGGMVPEQFHVDIVWTDQTLSSDVGNSTAAAWAKAAEYIVPANLEDLSEMVEKAKERENQERAARLAEKDRAKTEHAAFCDNLKSIVPGGTKAILLAVHVEDKCDYMSDYHGSSRTRSVVVGFSKHARDLFPEMRKAARNFSETVSLADAPKEAEHREKYSMGGGYYLKNGYRHSTGWKIEKVRIDPENPGAALPWGTEISETLTAQPKPKSPPRSTRLPGDLQAPGAVFGEIVPTVHTKKKFKMWIVTLSARVDRDTFQRLLDAARGAGGWYSRAWGNSPAGFAFKSEQQAKDFISANSSVDTSDAADTSDAVSAPVGKVEAERLQGIAESLQAQIDEKFRDRRENTPKQRKQAANARQSGADLKRAQRAAVALADCWLQGNVPPLLTNVTTKTKLVRLSAERLDFSNSGYYDPGMPTGKPVEDSSEAHALWTLAGTAKPDTNLHIADLVRKVRNSAPSGYYPTPPEVCERLLAQVDISQGQSVLEPSAGSGELADAVKKRFSVAPACFEINSALREILTAKGHTLRGRDFTEAAASLAGEFDFVVMNPPFEKGQDMEHVRLAYACLKPGGTLMSVMSPSWTYSTRRNAQDFKAWAESIGHVWEPLPENSFKASGTGVATGIFRVEKTE